MKNIHVLPISIIMSLGIFCILTLPHFIAFQTMDINNGHYRGYIYPLWLMLLIAVGSGLLGKLIVNKLSKNK